MAGAAFYLSLLDVAFGQEHHSLRLKVPEQRYTGVDMSSTIGSSLDLELYTEDGTQVIESHIEHQSDEADTVMWWQLDLYHFKVDSIYGVFPWNYPPVQNSREWLEVKGKYKRSGGTGGIGATPTFWADVVAADLDVAHGGGDEVDETVEESQGAYFQACTNIPAKLTLRSLQYKQGIGTSKSVELHKMQASADVHVYNDQALTQEITNWPVVTTHGALKNNPRYFYVTADEPSDNARDIEFEARSFPLDTGGYASDRVMLTAYRSRILIYVDQPEAETRNVVVLIPTYPFFYVGHSWWRITLEPNNALYFVPSELHEFVSQPVGYYPTNTPQLSAGWTCGAELRLPDTDHDDSLDITRFYSCSLDKMIGGLEYTKSVHDGPGTYDLDDRNCTDEALQAAFRMGIDLPDTQGEWPFNIGIGSNPGDLGEDLRLIPSF